MITQTFKHTHDCPHIGETVVVRPDVVNGAFFRKVPVCIFRDTELELVEEER